MDTSPWEKPVYTKLVHSIQELSETLKTADGGDVIALADGTYRDVELDIAADGVMVVAETSGAVFIEGISTITVSGENIILEGFTFRNGYPLSSSGAINVTGSHNRVTNCMIDSYNDEILEQTFKWISLNNKTTYNSIDHCTFKGKRSEGTILVVWRDDDSPNYHHIYRNVFMDYKYNRGDDLGKKGPDQNGFESIRIGTSQQSQSSSYTLVEYNYFNECDGEIEIISNKSGHNVYRYNTFESCSGQLTLRHGNTCTVDSNYFFVDDIYGGGIRIIDKDHLIINNYVEGATSGSNNRGGICITSHQTDPKLNGYWEASNLNISNNTIINSRQAFLYGSSAKANPPKSALFSHNLVRNGLDGTEEFDAIRVMGELTVQEPVYVENYYFGGDLGISPKPKGFSKKKVELIQAESGQYIAADGSVGASELERLDLSSDVGSSFQ
ncbi:MAG: polysaccharide lyase 6 family protein [Spirochaetales bacterium]|nr:polysaccharide lyase 6 family protein [Spirochaetales bacterium]